mgnify:FL=1
MKRFFCGVVGALMAFTAVAKEKAPEPDLYEYNNIISEITGVSAPYLAGDYIIFTAPKTSRYVGIAFDFEGYKQLHAYRLHNTYDYEGEITDSWFFYILEKPKDLTSISYRLVIDGLWTTDPSNPNSIFDPVAEVPVSRINLPPVEVKNTETVPAGYTRFVCFAPSGQKIRLGGTFTNWDSWIYEMVEVQRGKYQLDLPLPAGTYYYNYYRGITSFIDETNPSKGYTPDGRIASRIDVQ